MKKLLFAMAAALLLAGCQKEEIDPQNTAANSPGYNAATLLDHAANGVIVGTYRDLDQNAAALQTAVAALAAAPTPAALAAARQAYRDARAPWEATEAFAFGPVSTLGLDAVIDTWPLNRVDLAALLASTDPLSPASLRPRDGGLQGLVPAYAVWDLSGTYHAAKNLDLKAGVNNLTDAKYFTRRTDEYPGPGIIPSIGRSFYATLAAKF